MMSELYTRDLETFQPPQILAGIDEAGRGALAGPVVIAAVCLDYHVPIEGINDSKKLDPHTREKLYEQITSSCLAYAIVEISNFYIDRYNILQATLLGFEKAYAKLDIVPDICLIDGNRIPPALQDKATPVIKGDQLHACIAAASILAKVHRDRLMVKLDDKYPEYGFAIHKGYGTAMHARMIQSFGFCQVHRTTFHLASLESPE